MKDIEILASHSTLDPWTFPVEILARVNITSFKFKILGPGAPDS
jgi:hypothetical protein